MLDALVMDLLLLDGTRDLWRMCIRYTTPSRIYGINVKPLRICRFLPLYTTHNGLSPIKMHLKFPVNVNHVQPNYVPVPLYHMPLISVSPRSRRHGLLSLSRILQLAKLLPTVSSHEVAGRFAGHASAYGARPGNQYGDHKDAIGGQRCR